MSTIAFTGHRPNKLGNDYTYTSPLVKSIRTSIISDILNEPGPPHFIVGGALGIDTLAALIAIDLEIPFTLAAPCRDQDALWPAPSRLLYQEIMSKAARVVFVHDGPYEPWVMQKRNEWMVDQLTEPDDYLYAVWNGTPGGTANCIKYANRQGVEIHHLQI